MKYLLVVFSVIIGSQCRPQNPLTTLADPIQVQRQDLFEVHPKVTTPRIEGVVSQRKIEENTKEILEKIAQVNKKQGLTPKRPKPSYFHFPFSYSRSKESGGGGNIKEETKFRFTENNQNQLLRNPIFDYLNSLKTEQERSDVAFEPAQSMVPNSYGLQFISTNPNAEITPEDYVPGQYIKRKVVHQQTVIVPSGFLQGAYPMYQAPYPYQPPQLQSQDNLEDQTVDNIKFIVSNSQPYQPYQPFNPYLTPQPEQPLSRQWDGQWPGAQYFPIVIRDPLQHMFQAITSMVEYGTSNSAQNSACKKPKDELRSPKMETPSNFHLDIEDLNISNDSPMKFVVNLTPDEAPASPKAMKTTWDQAKFRAPQFNSTRQQTSSKQPLNFEAVTKKYKIESPPHRGPEFDDSDEEDDKAEDISINNDNNKKVFTRENTGSGIFIHKLKVRKGGVAIAGPGGIATAGSGGTAIVGPNGVAYTHPDSLAIAGSGSKVVAVDPLVNLGDLISNSTAKNRTLEAITASRVGKVVAVGPVVYYNKG